MNKMADGVPRVFPCLFFSLFIKILKQKCLESETERMYKENSKKKKSVTCTLFDLTSEVIEISFNTYFSLTSIVHNLCWRRTAHAQNKSNHFRHSKRN